VEAQCLFFVVGTGLSYLIRLPVIAFNGTSPLFVLRMAWVTLHCVRKMQKCRRSWSHSRLCMCDCVRA